jgi:hypothetical protein
MDSAAAWEDRLSELADYQIQHCNVPQHYSENTKLVVVGRNQRSQYKLHLRKVVHDTPYPGIESLGFEWQLKHLPGKTV